MRRLVACFAAVVLVLLLCPPVNAAGDGLYAEYVKKSDRATLFYIDIYMQREVSAAVWELTYDPEMAAYRSADAVNTDATVRAVDGDGCVRIAFADSAAVRGKLCRLGFKALNTGSCRFVLRLSQAADSDLRYLQSLPDYTLTVTLDKNDLDASASTQKSRGTKADGSSSRVSSKSSSAEDEDEEAARDGERSAEGIIHLPGGGRPWIYAALGAGAVLLMGALVVIGVIIGRKSRAAHEDPAPAQHQQGDR